MWISSSVIPGAVILGASNEDQLRENLAAVEVVDRLSEEVRGQIEAVVSEEPG